MSKCAFTVFRDGRAAALFPETRRTDVLCQLVVYLICTILLYKRCASVGRRLGLSWQGGDGVMHHALREMVIMLAVHVQYGDLAT